MGAFECVHKVYETAKENSIGACLLLTVACQRLLFICFLCEIIRQKLLE